MALANPPPPFAQMPSSLFDQGSNGTAASGTIPTVQSLLFLANSGATSTANQLLLTQSAASLSATNRPPHPPPPPPSFTNLLQGQSQQQQPQFKMESPSMEMDANEQQQQLQMAPTIGDGIGLPSPPSSSLSFPPPANSIGQFSPEYFGLAVTAAAHQHHQQQQQQQQLVDRSILELLLAKSNALSSLFGLGSSLFPNLAAALLPTLSLGAPNPYSPIGLLRAESLALPTPQCTWDTPSPPTANIENGVSLVQMNDKQEQQDRQDKLSIVESSQMESLSRNKLGRSYNPGRPLGMLDRQKILELYQKGFKISHIAKVIGVTHSCVSKIMTRYRRTGSIHPRSAQLSVLSRRQSAIGELMNPQQPTVIVPSAASANSLQMACWQQQWATGQQQAVPPNNDVGEENAATTLKCSVPSAFQRISPLEKVSSDEEEREAMGSSGSSSNSLCGLFDEKKMEQKAYLMGDRLT